MIKIGAMFVALSIIPVSGSVKKIEEPVCIFSSIGAKLCAEQEGEDGWLVTYMTGKSDFFYIDNCEKVEREISNKELIACLGKGSAILVMTKEKNGPIISFESSR